MTDADRYDPVSFLETAVQTPSHGDVSAMRELLVDTLATAGIDATVDRTGNVLAHKDGADPESGPHVVCNTHIDTVTPHVPFERDRHATVEGESGVDVVCGRGACDAKGPLAVLLGAFLAIEPERGRLTLAITPDEEVYSLGAAALTGRLEDQSPDDALEPGDEHAPVSPTLDGDYYVVGEPTGLDVCTAAKGRFEATVELAGETAHAAEFAGVNAVAAAEDALKAIRVFDRDRPVHDQLGAAKLTPTVIDGGAATNQIPDRCAITVDRRSIPPETADGFRESLQRDVQAAIPRDVGVSVQLTERESPFLEAFATEPDHEIVATFTTAIEETRPAGSSDRSNVSAHGAAETPSPRGGAVRPFSAATEASYFSPAPTIVFGPGDIADDDGAVAHSNREYVRVRDIEWATAAATRALENVLC